MKWFHIGAQEYRKRRAEGKTAFPKPTLLPKAKLVEIPSRDEGRSIKLRCFIPEGKIRGIYLHMHGGGWVLSDAAAQDPYLSRVAEAGMIAASVEYRLAPEYPSPRISQPCRARRLLRYRSLLVVSLIHVCLFPKRCCQEEHRPWRRKRGGSLGNMYHTQLAPTA